MKYLAITIFILVFVSCKVETHNSVVVNTKGLIGMIKTENSYEIYSNRGELILEFTKQNCDSSSLETLEYIYQTAKEFYNREPSKEEKEIQSIKHSEI